MKHRILLAASEVVGFAKTGGLADVAGALPRALARLGHECAVIMPLYRSVRQGKVPITRTSHTFSIPVGDRTVTGGLARAVLPGSQVPVYLVEQPDYFERDDSARGYGLYQFSAPGGSKRDYPDNCARFVFFCRAVLEALPHLDFFPEIVHANDWQTGLIPAYLREMYRERSDYAAIRTLLTIHNLAYQGLFWHWDMSLTGLDWRLFNYRQLEFYGHLNFLKAGIVFSDFLGTVSPTYAREIQTEEFGCGLEGVLAERRERLAGVVNGVDYQAWDPATDSRIALNYDVESAAKGKEACKRSLQRRSGLPERPDIPLLGMVSRLVEQKGISLVCQAAEAMVRENVHLVVLGEGEPIYHRMLLDLRDRFPDNIGVTLAFDETLAHQIEAGADLFLMPSQYEPSGLNQLYSLKYGAVPVVRATGGLADTITDATPTTLRAGTATGFMFASYHASSFWGAVQRGLAVFRQQPALWLQIVRTGMRQDWSWARGAGEYERIYDRLAGAGARTKDLVAISETD